MKKYAFIFTSYLGIAPTNQRTARAAQSAQDVQPQANGFQSLENTSVSEANF